MYSHFLLGYYLKTQKRGPHTVDWGGVMEVHAIATIIP